MYWQGWAGGGLCYGDTRRVRPAMLGSVEGETVVECSRVGSHHRPIFLILGRSAQDLCLQENSVTSSNWTHSKPVSTLNVPTLNAKPVTFIRLSYSK